MKRETPKRRWRIVLGGAVLLVTVLAGSYFLPLPPAFRFREVVILTQPTRLSELDLVKLMKVEKGANLLTLRLNPIRENLRKFPWIEEATIAKAYPGRLIVSIREEQPVVLVERGGLYLANRKGRLFKKMAKGDPKNFPVVTGWKESDHGRLVSLIRLADLFQEKKTLRTVGLSEIHWDAKQGVTLYTMRPVVKVALGETGWEGRLEKLEQVLPELGRGKGRPLSIDLTYEKRVFIKTQS